MSESPDPQTWVFPPLGARQPPDGVAAAFCPVSQGDKILLEWAPTSEKPTVNLLCSNDDNVFTIADESQSPFLYTFSESLGNGSDTGVYVCHFFFADTEVGNTVTFQALNSASGGSSTTWEQDSQLQSAFLGAATTVTQTASAAVSTRAFTPTSADSQPDTTPTAASDASSPSATSTSSGLSAGAAARIGVVAAAVFFALLFAGFLVWRRVRASRQQAPMPMPMPISQHGTENPPQVSKVPHMGQPNAYPPPVGPNTRPMYAELNNQGIYEIGAGR